MAEAVAAAVPLAIRDPDEALVAEARERPAAFAALYERYLPGIYRYLRARSSSPEEAADLTQVVFLRALDALPRYRSGKAPFAAWLFRIARNLATDAHRRRRPAVSWDGLPEPPAAFDGSEPETVVLKHERLGRLRALLSGLDPAKRELLALRFAAGLSAREIAPIVDKSESAVKKQLTRIIANLKEHYHEELAEGGESLP